MRPPASPAASRFLPRTARQSTPKSTSSRASSCPVFGVPEPDGVVIRARGEAAVGQHGERPHRIVMAFEPCRLLAGFASQSRMVLSAEPEARRPSGSTASALTQPPWPSSRAVSCPVLASQSRMVLSREPEARRPSGSTASALTESVMAFEPCRLLSGFRVPEPDGVVVGARGEAAVGQHRQRVHPTAMAFEPGRLLCRFSRPRAGWCCHQSPRRGGRRAAPPARDPTAMAFEPGRLLAGFRRPRAGWCCRQSPRRGGRRAAPRAPSPNRHGLRAWPSPCRFRVPEPDGAVI